MAQPLTVRVAHFAILLAPGIYIARLLCEIARPTLPVALILTVLLSLAGALLLKRWLPTKSLWFLLPLYLYIAYPLTHPPLAIAVLAVCALAAAFLAAQRPALSAAPSPRLLAVLLFFSALALYRHTLAPGLLPADSGELQLVAAQLGVAHPPGFALYTLLAHLFTRLPFGPDAAYRANLFSALIAAATLSITFLTSFQLTASRRAALISVIALAGATTFWSQATTANVRMLAAFFAILAIYWLLLYRRRVTTSATQPALPPTLSSRLPSSTLLFLFALTISLGITHHASLAFMFTIFILALVWLEPRLLRRPRAWIAPLAGLLLGLLPLLYFPLRAVTAAGEGAVRGVSPALATLPGFLQHVLALGFRGDLFAFTTPRELLPRLQVMANVMSFQFHWLLLLGMLAGFLILLRHSPLLAAALGGSFALHTLITAAYRAPQTVEYMLPAYIPAVLLLAVAATPPLTSHAGAPRRARYFRAMLTAALLVITVAQAQQRYPSFRQLSGDQSAHAYAATLLQQAPAYSVVLAGWHWASPLWFLQEIGAQRPDLSIQYVFPTAEPYAATWARRIAESLDQGRAVVATNFDAAAYATLPPPRPLGQAFLFGAQPLYALPDSFTPLTEELGGALQLAGYTLASPSLRPLHEAELVIAWRLTGNASASGVTLFAHLVGAADGAIYAQQDLPALPQPVGLTITSLRLTPRLTAQPGDYHLFVGAYDSATGEPLLSASGRARTRLQSVPLQAMAHAPYTHNPVWSPPAAGEQRLVGYDWDQTLAPHTRLYLHWRTPQGYISTALEDPPPAATLPSFSGPWGLARSPLPPGTAAPRHYVPLGLGIIWSGSPGPDPAHPAPGDAVRLVQHFAATHPLQQDLVVSVRLIGYEADGFHWDWWRLHDTVPALGAIPTLKWTEGSRIRDPHYLTVSADAPPGQTLGGLVTVYDAFTQRPLPILDERITAQYPGIPLPSTFVAK